MARTSQVTTIYLIVGGRVRLAQARIVGKIAEVKTPYGIREFGKFFLSESEALAEVKKKGNYQGQRDDAALCGGSAAPQS